MTPSSRIREVLRLLPAAVVMWIISRVAFDFVVRRPPFWATTDSFLSMLWSGAFIVPFMLFALAVAAQRQKTGTDR